MDKQETGDCCNVGKCGEPENCKCCQGPCKGGCCDKGPK